MAASSKVTEKSNNIRWIFSYKLLVLWNTYYNIGLKRLLIIYICIACEILDLILVQTYLYNFLFLFLGVPRILICMLAVSQKGLCQVEMWVAPLAAS